MLWRGRHVYFAGSRAPVASVARRWQSSRFEDTTTLVFESDSAKEEPDRQIMPSDPYKEKARLHSITKQRITRAVRGDALLETVVQAMEQHEERREYYIKEQAILKGEIAAGTDPRMSLLQRRYQNDKGTPVTFREEYDGDTGLAKGPFWETKRFDDLRKELKRSGTLLVAAGYKGMFIDRDVRDRKLAEEEGREEMKRSVNKSRLAPVLGVPKYVIRDLLLSVKEGKFVDRPDNDNMFYKADVANVYMALMHGNSRELLGETEGTQNLSFEEVDSVMSEEAAQSASAESAGAPGKDYTSDYNSWQEEIQRDHVPNVTNLRLLKNHFSSSAPDDDVKRVISVWNSAANSMLNANEAMEKIQQKEHMGFHGEVTRAVEQGLQGIMELEALDTLSNRNLSLSGKKQLEQMHETTDRFLRNVLGFSAWAVRPEIFFRTYDLMRVMSQVPNHDDYLHALDMYSNLGLPDRMIDLVNYLELLQRRGQLIGDYALVSLETYNKLLEGLVANGEDEKAHQVYSEMVRGKLYRPTDSTILTLIKACERRRMAEKAKLFFDDLYTLGYNPNETHYEALLKVYAQRMDFVNRSQLLVEEMKALGMEVSPTTMALLLKAAANAGHVDLAHNIFHNYLLPAEVADRRFRQVGGGMGRDQASKFITDSIGDLLHTYAIHARYTFQKRALNPNTEVQMHRQLAMKEVQERIREALGDVDGTASPDPVSVEDPEFYRNAVLGDEALGAYEDDNNNSVYQEAIPDTMATTNAPNNDATLPNTSPEAVREFPLSKYELGQLLDETLNDNQDIIRSGTFYPSAMLKEFANQRLLEAENMGVKIGPVNALSYLRIWTHNLDYEGARHVFEQVLPDYCQPFLPVAAFRTMIHCATNTGHMGYAQQLLDRIPVETSGTNGVDEQSCYYFIHACGLEGFYDRGIETMERMTSVGITPDPLKMSLFLDRLRQNRLITDWHHVKELCMQLGDPKGLWDNDRILQSRPSILGYGIDKPHVWEDPKLQGKHLLTRRWMRRKLAGEPGRGVYDRAAGKWIARAAGVREREQSGKRSALGD
eukprot:Clim_evm20s108 gene=Clim_evmTU20s108